MLSFLRRCRAPVRLSKYAILPSLFPLPSTELSSISAATLSIDDPIADSPSPTQTPIDPIGEVIVRLRSFGLKDFVGWGYSGSILSRLNQFHVDRIVDDLKAEGPDLVFGFFDLLRNEYRFRHSRFTWLLVSHVLAGDRRFRQLGSVLQALLDEEGSGSAPLLCDSLSLNFLDWKSNTVVWDALAFTYSRKEMVHDALFVLDRMKDLEIRTSVPTYNSLLHNLRHTNFMCDIYKEFKDTGIPASEFTDSIVLDGLCKQSRFQEAVSFMWENDSKEFSPTVVSFNTIMSGFCRMGYLNVAQSFFCLMLKCGLPPDVYSYNTMIQGLFIAGLMEEALEFADDMEKNGIGPDFVTYRILVMGLMNAAWRIIEKMLLYGWNGTAIASHVLLSSMCKNGCVLEAFRFLRDQDTGLKTDVVTYSIVIHCLCKHGEVQKAIMLYEEMPTKGIFPNSWTHSSLLLSKGTLQEARGYFDDLRESSLVEDIVWYNIMLDRYVKLGNTEDALHLFVQILKRGITPTVVTFNSLMYGFCRQRKLAEARKLLGTIKSTGLVPSSITYTTLMDAYSEEGNIESVLVLFKEMEAENVVRTFVTYTVVIKGLCKQLWLQDSIQCLKDMYAEGLKPDEITYNIIIQCALKLKDTKRAFELYDEMFRHHLEPTPATYNILINGLCLQGDLLYADCLFISLQEKNITLSKVAYTTIIKAHCAKKSVRRAMRYFYQLMEMGYDVSIQDYSAVINRLCKTSAPFEAKFVFYRMLYDGILPDHDMCEIMLNAFHRSGDLKSKFQIIAEMIKFGLLPY